MRIPVIRGEIGDWRYYTGVMNFKQISEAVESSVEKFCSPSCLSDLLQRELTDNYKSIKEYIQKDSQRFFNSIVLAIYDGDPKWLEVEFSQEYEVYNVGFLEINSDVKIFPVDGQHRVKGIEEAIVENPELESEQVPVIFIAHRDTEEGKRRTRKLFSTLNRRAKPVGENSQIALDEDDVTSIITRELIEDYPLFQNERLRNYKSKQIPKSDTQSFTSLVAFYQCNEILVQDKLEIRGKQYKEFQLYRPNDEIIQDILVYVKEFWDAFINRISVIQEFLNNDEKAAYPFRNEKGGNILFRPIGLIEFVRAVVNISKKKDQRFNDTLLKLDKISMDLEDLPWKGVFWDGKKIINRVNLKLINCLIMFMEDEFNLSEEEYNDMLELYILATNFEGDIEEIIVELNSIKG